MRKLVLTTILAALSAAPALASERCSVPGDQWRSVDELKSALTDSGWTVSNVKTEDGCYEVYGRDADGKRVEIFFDPRSFEMVGSDD